MSTTEFATEWGVAWSLPESHGTDALRDRQTAERMVKNMKSAGHEARIVWRGITPWHEAETDAKVEAQQ